MRVCYVDASRRNGNLLSAFGGTSNRPIMQEKNVRKSPHPTSRCVGRCRPTQFHARRQSCVRSGGGGGQCAFASDRKIRFGAEADATESTNSSFTTALLELSVGADRSLAGEKNAGRDLDSEGPLSGRHINARDRDDSRSCPYGSRGSG